MNKQIAELMIEAGKTIPGDKHIDADFCNKFAELIVRECSKIAYQNDVAKFTRDGYVIGQEIEKHFGVE